MFDALTIAVGVVAVLGTSLTIRTLAEAWRDKRDIDTRPYYGTAERLYVRACLRHEACRVFKHALLAAAIILMRLYGAGYVAWQRDRMFEVVFGIVSLVSLVMLFNSYTDLRRRQEAIRAWERGEPD